MDSTTKSTNNNNNNNNRQDHTIELESFNTITNQKIEYANLISFNSNNYFHFMVETLSLVLFQNYFKNKMMMMMMILTIEHKLNI